MVEDIEYVVTYDNGSGYREYASLPQSTPETAWQAANLNPGDQYFPGSDAKLEQIKVNAAKTKA